MTVSTDISTAIGKIFKFDPPKLQAANAKLAAYNAGLINLVQLMESLNGITNLNFVAAAVMHQASFSSDTIKAITTALGSNVPGDLAKLERIGDPSVPLETDATDLTGGVNELAAVIGTVLEEFVSTDGILTITQLSAGSNIKGAKLSASANIIFTQLSADELKYNFVSTGSILTTTQLSAGANIKGTELSAGAAINGGQLASNAGITSDQITSLVGSKISGTEIIGTQLSDSAGIQGTQLAADTITSFNLSPDIADCIAGLSAFTTVDLATCF